MTDQDECVCSSHQQPRCAHYRMGRCAYKPPPWEKKTEPDNRMVKCVLDGYDECAAKTPEACVCYQMQRLAPWFGFSSMYEWLYQKKYGEDQQ